LGNTDEALKWLSTANFPQPRFWIDYNQKQESYSTNGYLPKEKILINADLYVSAEPGAKPTPPATGMRMKYRDMKELDLDVAQHVSIVGQRVGSNDEFVKLFDNAK
jgi:hypothetical protein